MTSEAVGEKAMTNATTAERMRGTLLVRAARLMPRRRGARAAALAALLALAAGGAWGVHAWAARGGAADQVTIATVQRGDLEDAVTATGILQPRDYVDVGTQVSGQLKKLAVEIGSRVKAGQLIAEIDPTVYQSRVEADQAQLRTQQAQLVDKQAQLTLAQQQHERQVNMMKDNATTQEALQTAEAALGSARAQIDVLKAQIEQTQSTLRGDQASLSYTKIYAPMAGTVVAQSAKQGQTLNANQQAPVIVRIADLSTMTVQSQVSEADVSKLRPGMPVYFTTLGETGKRWSGTLRQINPTPETVNNVVLYDALFDVDNRDGALMTQMTAQVFFVAAEARGAVLVPVSALRPAKAPGAPRRGPRSTDAAAAVDPRTSLANGPAAVRVVAPDGSIAPREVRVGVVSRVSAQIVSGLQPGERVVAGQRAAAPAAAAKPAAGGSSRPMMGPRV
jgi:membrane fusion protein, macrolide-specific efflux system